MSEILIQASDEIGNVDAEYDEKFLFDCFVYSKYFTECNDVNSPKSFIYGRTGAGKTAILKLIERKNDCSHIIDLTEISLDYISNSTVIQFLSGIGVSFDLFLQTMWKHVLCLEYIKLRFLVDNEQKSKNFFGNLSRKFSKDNTKQRALKYLEKYADKFWIDTDRVIRELTETFESQIQANAKAEIDKFSMDAGYSRKLSEERKIHLQARFKKFVSSDTLSELNRVMRLLKEYDAGSGKPPVFILIDKVDEEWVEEDIKYKLIRSLIEAQRSFGKISDLKILVTIRADIFERVLQETMKPGMQREKFDDQLSQISWKPDQLKRLVDLRIRQMCKFKYEKTDVGFDDIFTHNVGQKDPFEYMLERTHYRPRDIISFVNSCLNFAEGKGEVGKRDITEAEKAYSTVRLEALKNEWVSALPAIYDMLELVSNRKAGFTVSELMCDDTVDSFILNLYEKSSFHKFDPVHQFVASNWSNLNSKVKSNLKKLVISEQYRVGVVSIKLKSGDRHYHSFKDTPIIAYNQIGSSSKVRVHPAYHIALNVHR